MEIHGIVDSHYIPSIFQWEYNGIEWEYSGNIKWNIMAIEWEYNGTLMRFNGTVMTYELMEYTLR